jgi:hypothetical protein
VATVTKKEVKAAANNLDAVDRLVEAGASRLTAERIVAIERGLAEAGRARRHTTSRY